MNTSNNLSRTGEFTLLLCATLTIMVGAAVAPGLIAIAKGLQFTQYPSLLITLPALGAIIFAPLFGRWIDKHGARKTLLLSLWSYCVLGLSVVLLSSEILIAANRIVLGGFAAGVMAAGTALISQWYTGEARLKMIAKQGMAIELGGVIFLFIGGILAQAHWKAAFLLYGIAAVCALLVVFSVPSNQKILTSRNRTSDHKAKDVVSSFSGIKSILSFAVCAMALFFSMVVSLPQHLEALDYSEAHIGYILSYISLVAVVAASLLPRFVKAIKEKRTLSLSFLCFGAALFVFGSFSEIQAIMLAATFAGTGFGLSIPLLNHATVEISQEENRGKNLSFFAMAVFAGQFFTSIIDFLPVNLNLVFFIFSAVAVCISIGAFSSTLFSTLLSKLDTNSD